MANQWSLFDCIITCKSCKRCLTEKKAAMLPGWQERTNIMEHIVGIRKRELSGIRMKHRVWLKDVKVEFGQKTFKSSIS